MNVARIIIGIDFSDLAPVAAEAGFALARRMGANVHLVHVIDHYLDPFAATGDHTEQDAFRRKEAEEKLAKFGAEDLKVTREIQFGVPARDLAEAAKAAAGDLLVVASHGYGAIKRLVLGSVAASVIRSSEVPVLVVGPDRAEVKLDVVLAGVDLSGVSAEVLSMAAGLVTDGGHLQIVSACDRPIRQGSSGLPAVVNRTDAEAERKTALAPQVDPILQEANGRHTTSVEAVARAPAALVLLESAKVIGAGLIVVGTSGHSAWHRAFVGSTATRVLSEAECPALVVPFAGD